MADITITEALASIKTTGKRIDKKRESIMLFIGRQDGIRDPLEKDGGSATFIERERQSIADLETDILTMRRGIQRANDATVVTIGQGSQSISDWLVWRRDVAPKQKAFLDALRKHVAAAREQAKRQGVQVVSPGTAPAAPTDIIINIDEAALARDIEALETILGNLDGQLSLKNATIAIIKA